MRSALPCSGLLLALVLLLVGCGGSSHEALNPPTGGSIVGTLAADSQPQGYTIYLDGQELTRRPNASGAFRVPGVAPGEHVICLIAPDGIWGVYAAVVVQEGQDTDLGTLDPRLGGRITGTVTKRTENGLLEPLPDVEVVATPGPLYLDSGGRNDELPTPSDEPPIVVFTDEDGVYDMRAVPPGGYVVTVSVPGLRGGIRFVHVEPGHTAVADFVLWPAPPEGVGTVEGRVYGMNETGAIPLEGARVTVTPELPWWPIILDDELEEVADAIGVTPDIFPPPIRPEFSTLTNARGHYSLNVPAGPAVVRVFAEGYAPQSREIGVRPRSTTMVDFRLRRWREEPPPPPPGVEPPAPPSYD